MTHAHEQTSTSPQTTRFPGRGRIVVGWLPIDIDIAGFVPVPSAPSGVRDGSRQDRLTTRERQVFERISEGLSNKQIATRLGIAIHTVKCHVHNILGKLGVDNRVQVAVFGRSAGAPGWRSGADEFVA